MDSRATFAPVAMILAALAVSGCRDTTGPRDVYPPSAPRGVYSVTGDRTVYLRWIENPEPDLAGYRVYISTCPDGPECLYELEGTTTTAQFDVGALQNGVTLYYAVAAVDHAGNESELSYENVFDTPRPEGFDAVLTDAAVAPATSGWDFSDYGRRAFDDPAVDVYYAVADGANLMVAPFTDTDIQDAGYANTLDAIDWAPNGGWSPTGTVELIAGHCYVVWTHDNHFAKFRVSRISNGSLVMDWAYQVDPGNPELAARRAHRDGERVRRTGLP
jgi:hypothetical protein